MSQPNTGGPGVFGYDAQGQIANGTNNHGYLLSLILGALQQIGTALGVTGGSTTAPTLTPHSSIVTGAGTIPAGAKGWTFTVLTGTPTFNGATSLPVGFSDSDTGVTAVAIAYDATGGSAYVRYNT